MDKVKENQLLKYRINYRTRRDSSVDKVFFLCQHEEKN